MRIPAGIRMRFKKLNRLLSCGRALKKVTFVAAPQKISRKIILIASAINELLKVVGKALALNLARVKSLGARLQHKSCVAECAR